jgi:hypothetical protein
MREKEKREAASAIAFSFDDNQTEEKEKSSRHARATKLWSRPIVGAERIDRLWMLLKMASLSTWNTTCAPANCSPQQRIA